METVDVLIEGTKDLYVNQKVFDFIMSFNRKDKNRNVVNPFLKKLDYLSRRGFDKKCELIKYEWDGVYRIRFENERIIGFYDNLGFIGINCFHKTKQELSKPQREIIDKVAKIRAKAEWELKEAK